MDYKKNWFSKAIKYREIVLKTELLGSCHYFDVHTENIHYTRLRLIKDVNHLHQVYHRGDKSNAPSYIAHPNMIMKCSFRDYENEISISD